MRKLSLKSLKDLFKIIELQPESSRVFHHHALAASLTGQLRGGKKITDMKVLGTLWGLKAPCHILISQTRTERWESIYRELWFGSGLLFRLYFRERNINVTNA